MAVNPTKSHTLTFVKLPLIFFPVPKFVICFYKICNSIGRPAKSHKPCLYVIPCHLWGVGVLDQGESCWDHIGLSQGAREVPEPLGNRHAGVLALTQHRPRMVQAVERNAPVPLLGCGPPAVASGLPSGD